MSDKNAHLVDASGAQPLWPVPPRYESPWSYAILAERVNAIPPQECCRGLVDLLLEMGKEVDQRLSKALLDVWALEGILHDN